MIVFVVKGTVSSLALISLNLCVDFLTSNFALIKVSDSPTTQEVLLHLLLLSQTINVIVSLLLEIILSKANVFFQHIDRSALLRVISRQQLFSLTTD